MWTVLQNKISETTSYKQKKGIREEKKLIFNIFDSRYLLSIFITPVIVVLFKMS